MSQAHDNGAMPAPPALRVLLIGDSPSDATWLRTTLQKADARTRIYEAGSFLTGLDRLAVGDIDLVVLDLAVKDNQGLDGVRAIHTYAPGVHVVALVVTGHDSTPLRALQMGAEDCLVKSKLDGERLARVLHRLALQHAAPEPDHSATPSVKRAAVAGLLGSKGGVGTTTTACHLALEIKRQAAGRVLLMDLDMTANSVGLLMKAQSKHTVLEAANSIIHLDEARWNDLITHAQGGLEVLPSGGPACREDQLPRIERIRCLLRFIRSLYDWIVLDLGRLTPFTWQLCAELTQVVVVSSLDPAALNGTAAVARGLQEAGIPNKRLAVNRTPKTPDLTQAEIQQLVNLPVEVMLPECEQQFKETMSATHLLGQSRNFSAQMAQLVRKLSGGVEEGGGKKLFGLFRLRA